MIQSKWFLLLHIILGIYAGSSVCSKLAAQQPFLSAAFIVLYGLMLLALGCVCSSTLPSWLWAKISKNTAAKLIVFALLAVLCVCYVVAATNATALYANF